MSEIRLATLEDAAAIAKVQVDTWQKAYRGILSDEQLDSLSYEQRELRWRAHLRGAHARTYVCVVSGEVVGYSTYRPI